MGRMWTALKLKFRTNFRRKFFAFQSLTSVSASNCSH
jgi:hypothetical protein